MKRSIKYGLFILCLCIAGAAFTSSILGYMSDELKGEATIRASDLQVSIEDFSIGFENSDGSMNWHSRNEDQQFGGQLVQNGIITIQFVIRNYSHFDLDINGYLELSFVNEQGEQNVLLLYPQEIDNSVILNNATQNIDTDAIIGFDFDDTQSVTNGTETRMGYKKQVITDSLSTIEGEGDGFNSKRYAFKLTLSDANLTLDELKSIVTGNKVGIGVGVDAFSQGTQSNWSQSVFEYGEVKTIIDIPNSLTMDLIGDNPMVIAQNTPYKELGARALNELNEDVPVTISGTVDTSTYGTYTIEYRAEYKGIVIVKTRTVYVNDGTPPLITPKNDTPEKFVTESLNLSDLVKLTDNVDSEAQLKANLVITTPEGYDSKVPGVYKICYNVKDNSGMDAIEKCVSLTIFSYKEVVPMYDTGMALTTHGRVYSWGYSGNGETGRNTRETQLAPGEIETLKDHNIVQIEGGQYYGMARSDAGRLFVWGYNGYGMQGQGINGTNNLVPVEIKGVGNVIQIDGSFYTALALNDQGDVYSWGSGDAYGSGLGTGAITYTPTKMEFPAQTRIKYISSGSYSGYAISEDNQLYAWGRNNYRMLLDESRAYLQKPTNVTQYLPSSIQVENIKEIALGTNHVYFLMNDGSLYAWGSNVAGQLGNMGVSSGYNLTPQLVTDFSNNGIKIDKISAGWYYGVALDDQGRAYAWGESAYGSYGVSGNRYSPQLISQKEVTHIVSIGAYYATTGLITSDGYLYMAGSNNLADLGIGAITSDKYEWVKTLNP